jgi:vacuolar-type H+-ATPase subunit H
VLETVSKPFFEQFYSARPSGHSKTQSNGVFGAEIRLSGIEAVRKIVETEAQAKHIVEEAESSAQDILANASEKARKVRQASTAEAEQRKVQMLRETREKAEADARNSDEETDSLLENYKKLFENRKDAATKKAVDLILGE